MINYVALVEAVEPELHNTSPEFSSEPHECERKCLEGSTKTCEYHFTVEWYLTMSKVKKNYTTKSTYFTVVYFYNVNVQMSKGKA